jgi:hypothetical protein
MKLSTDVDKKANILKMKLICILEPKFVEVDTS